jgi:uncharacterized protein (TIGR02391 family)
VPRLILDAGILEKIAKQRGGAVNPVRVLVSKKARKLSISPQAALVLLATEHDVPTTVYQRKLTPEINAEIRAGLQNNSTKPSIGPSSARSGNKNKRAHSVRPISDKQVVKRAVALLIRDPQLRSRCSDILLARSNFDRPINQATQILEDRIRRKAKPSTPMVGENLANYAFKENLGDTVLRVASNDADLQRGLSRIVRGMVPAFRNATHHHIVDTYTQEDALSVCFFVDLLLRAVDDSVSVP